MTARPFFLRARLAAIMLPAALLPAMPLAAQASPAFPAPAYSVPAYSAPGRPVAAAPAAPVYPAIAEVDPVTALGRYLRMLAANPRDLASLTGAGRAALAVGDANAALGFYARAEEIAPRNGRIKAGLATALVQMEQPRTALKLFDEAVALGVPQGEIASDRGLANDLVGDGRRAQADYAIALRAGGDDETVRRLALSLAISGDRAAALTMLDPLVRRRDGGAIRARAFVLALTGDQAGAASAVRGAMPGPQAGAMATFMSRLAKLNPAQKALAVNFGYFPSDGRSYSAAELFADARAASPSPSPPAAALAARAPQREVRDGASLIPAREALGPAIVTADAAAPRRRPGQVDVPMEILPPAHVLAAPIPGYTPPPVAVPTLSAAPVEAGTPGAAPSTGGPAAAARPGFAMPGFVAAGGNAYRPPVAGMSPPSAIYPTGLDVAGANPAHRPVSATSPAGRGEPPVPHGTAPAHVMLYPPRPTTATGPAARHGAGIAPATRLAMRDDAEDQGAPAKARASDRTAASRAADRRTAGRDAPAETKGRAARADARGDTKPKEQADAAAAKSAGKGAAKGRGRNAKNAGAAADDADVPAAAPGSAGKGKGKADGERKSGAKPAANDRAGKGGARPDALADGTTGKAGPKAAGKAGRAKAGAAKAAAEPAARPRLPERYWVQVASGSNKANLDKAWGGVKDKAPKLLNGKTTYTAPWHASNRLLIGPFRTEDEAQAQVNKLAKAGVSGIQFTTRAGTDVEKVTKD